MNDYLNWLFERRAAVNAEERVPVAQANTNVSVPAAQVDAKAGRPVARADTVSIEGLRVVRGGREVLHGVSTTIPGGSITGLIGPSGCGKSTLMRAIVGVQVVTSGLITVLGLPAGSPDLRRRIGYSTQSPAVYADLTIAENLRYFAAVLGAEDESIDRVLAAVGLTERRNQPAGSLSGGQLSRTSLAVALLGDPQLLVLDEPTVGLDPVLRDDLWELFRSLATEGVTLLVSSHVMDEAERCPNLILMRDGAILARDTPDRLRERTGSETLEGAFLRLVRGEPQEVPA
jgi:ABC-2 type transport system ATP-binding protein